MNKEDGLNKEEVDQIVGELTANLTSSVYGYRIVGDLFKQVPDVFDDDRSNPTRDDLMFASQHFDQVLKPFLLGQGSEHITFEEFKTSFDAIFDGRDISVSPILNYLHLQGKVQVYSEIIELVQ